MAILADISVIYSIFYTLLQTYFWNIESNTKFSTVLVQI